MDEYDEVLLELGLSAAAIERIYRAVKNDETPLVSLAAVVEAELVLAQHWAERHGCGCPRHRPWRAV